MARSVTVVLVVCVVSVLCMASVSVSENVCPFGTVVTVQSIPVDLPQPTYPWTSTYSAWLSSIENAKSTIDIACYYMTLSDGSDFPPGQGGYMGLDIYKAIIAAGKRGVKVRIVQQKPDARMPDYDTRNLTAMGVAEVRSIDFANVNGYSPLGGILHTKFIVVDDKDAYIGSANMDWRALSQVKELGIMVNDCPEYAKDVGKIFTQYWLGAAASSLPTWPETVYTKFNEASPMLAGTESSVMYVASGPESYAPSGRTNELDSILAVIETSKRYLKFSVMDYTPTSMYTREPFYWPIIDNALRSAAFRGVQVQLMFSIWNSTNPRQLPYWRSLSVIPNIQVRTYRLPQSPHLPPAPFTRVDHSKYILSDSRVYVTTSNCGADYYLYTGGVSVSIMSPYNAAVRQIKRIFDDDWSSPWANSTIPETLPPRPRAERDLGF